MNNGQKSRIYELTIKALDNDLLREESQELESYISSSKELAAYYATCIKTHLCLVELDASERTVQTASHPGLDPELWQMMAIYENIAPKVALSKEEKENILIQKVAYPAREKQKMSKFSIVSLALNAAAILFIVLFIQFAPSKHSIEIATLKNSVNAQWSSDLPLQNGTRLAVSAGEPIQLHQGVIEIETDKGAIITLEGPALFNFISPDQISMDYGRLYASVPQAASGFSVQTQNSTIIDIGTHFGVYAAPRGETELHVFKGSTMLIAGKKDQNKTTVEVTGGQAFRVDSHSSKVSDIRLKTDLFARGIDPDTHVLITNGKRIDLADMVGGGNGSGVGYKNHGIQWDGTKIVSAYMPLTDNMVFPTDYVPVRSSPFIDGIFVPNCKGQTPQTLSSNTNDLNLDDFIASDTNGQLTLVLLHETTDGNAVYWFDTKECSPGNPAIFPTLTFPNASATEPVQITTADGSGADTCVSNDTLRAPAHKLGKSPSTMCRYLKNERIHITYLRFDISSHKAFNLTDAILSLHLEFGTRYRNLQVYGLKDGPGDLWDETTICYNNAPGLRPSPLGDYDLDSDAFDLLGIFPVIDNRISTDPIQITANNLYQWNAPNTLHRTQSIISNTDRSVFNGTSEVLMLDTLQCGTDEHPSIFMHANAGITFDLDAIRRAYGPVCIESFNALCGISKTTANTSVNPAASFYVLVDGKEVFNAIDLSPEDGPQPIEIELEQNARYLTLAATQGTDNSIENDNCLFANPNLILK